MYIRNQYWPCPSKSNLNANSADIKLFLRHAKNKEKEKDISTPHEVENPVSQRCMEQESFGMLTGWERSDVLWQFIKPNTTRWQVGIEREDITTPHLNMGFMQTNKDECASVCVLRERETTDQQE